jgi:hypothetical protein
MRFVTARYFLPSMLRPAPGKMRIASSGGMFRISSAVVPNGICFIRCEHHAFHRVETRHLGICSHLVPALAKQ